jgi:drug/metabolite transporter (DMT)-like permease
MVQKEKIKITKKDYWLLLFLSVYGYALTNLFFTFGMLYTQISNALFIFYSFSIITPLLAFVFLKEKINRFTGMALGLTSLSDLSLPAKFSNNLEIGRINGLFSGTRPISLFSWPAEIN